jgi:hypothetical protein
MAMKVEVLTGILDRVAAERRDEHDAAIEQGKWRAALDALFTSLIWRTIALALRLGLASPQFDPRTDPVVLARRLRNDIETALAGLAPTDDKADLFHKAQTVGEVLDGILDVVGAAEAWTGADPQEPFFLSVIAAGLGRAEVELGFAESGFWEQVAEWRDRKPAGRSVGWRIKWRREAAPDIQSWIDADPSIKPKALIGKLAKWLEDYGTTHPDEKMPDEESLRKALDAMHKDDLIQLPWK